MSLSTLLLTLFVLFQALAYLGWYSVGAKILGVIGLAYVIVLVLELLGVLRLNLPLRRS